MEASTSAMQQVVSLQRDRATLAFETFFEAEGARLFRAMRLVTGSRAEAEECCQDAFFKVWQRWDSVSRMDNPSGYLYRTALNGYRKGYRRAVLRAKQFVRMAPAEDPQLTIEARDECARWFAGLTPRQRSAVVLIELLAFSTKEAAAAMRVKPGTVLVLLSQARAALRQTMGSDDE